MTPGQTPVPDTAPQGAAEETAAGPSTSPPAPSGLLSVAALSSTRVLSLALGVAGGTLSAAYFGAGVAKDCYIVAQTIPALLGTIAIAGLYTSLMVALADVGRREGVRGQIALIGGTLRQLSLVLIPLALVATFFPRPFLALVAPGFGPEQIALSGRMLSITMFAMIASVYFAVVRALYNARHQFGVPGLVYLLVGAVSLATLVLFVRPWGIFALALGPLFGGVLAAGVLGLLAGRLLRDPAGFVPESTGPKTPARGRARLWADFVPMSIGANFGQVNLMIDNAFASFLPPGNITQLGFASVIVSNAELLAIFSLAEVAFSRLTAASLRATAALEEEVRLNLRSMILMTAPIAAGCLVFGTPLARLLFERGQFGPDATAAVARILACFAPEVLFMGFFAIFWRTLAALRRTWTMVWTSLGAMAANAVLDAILMRRFGSSGIALATSIVTMLFAVVLGILVRRNGVRLLAPGDALYGVRVVVSAVIMAAAVGGWTMAFEGTADLSSEPARLLETGGGLALGALVYAAMLHLLGIRVVTEVLGRMARATGGWGRGR
ncbi:MAG TPA: lipid II flippase MurJ [Candidatus Cryosericum sp.]|nr:lipid II flippase MurJ [Candidatus Cryosericum sp.]